MNPDSLSLRMKNGWRVYLLYGIMLLIFLSIFNYFAKTKLQQKEKVQYSDFIAAVERGEVESVKIIGQNIEGEYRSGKHFNTYAPFDPDLVKILREKKIGVTAESDAPSFLMTILWSLLPMLLIFSIFGYVLSKMQVGGKAMQFGKSKAKLLNENEKHKTFKDVAGVEEAKEELKEIIAFLKNPSKFKRLGGRIPKGVLLVGPPGTGKTLLARAVAGEAGVPFFSIAGSDFVEMFVGVGAARVRDLFAEGKKNAPCIIFIDELDAVGRHRGTGMGGGHDEREQTLNQMLVEMDGFETDEGVIIMAATNRPDVLDPALLRPGRFDRRVVVPRPDVAGRKEILMVHTGNVPLAENVDLNILARGTPGASGADLENMVNEAALLAANQDQDKIEMKDFEKAKDKWIMGGAERKSLVISPKDKKITAYHESGHTLVSKSLEGADPVYKVTIIPQGMSMGATGSLPEEDRHNYSKSFLEIELAILMGGRVSEEIIFGDFSTGAANDIERATDFARKMVTEWGMSKKMGPIKYGDAKENPFVGMQMASGRGGYSEQTAMEIDSEIRCLVTEAYDKAKFILNQKRHILEALAKELLEKEKLDGADVDRIIRENQNPSSV